ncbi:mersacidin family lantibiotic [Streptococcus suis]|uniref:mersacidin family lantibiotic n=1 Tax=Streptococcus suis TaxID=1307 RepID=UPI0004274AEA|nr:lichenicidin A2 family type 2 lantibiotic [Streptococcus suis]MBS8066541.1 type 2 lantibiotic [Streptococcus suis]MBS8081859.1 type 2 lantibiotic [Streptococcus suis]MBS8111963.1 type 2 lantibiotic [Streptococcus suis]MCB2862949.1 lichenicidin A2 family type 2 lantibiotic [Streptococcus suis]MCB2889418.1 lichenicidin A2 family type 2 lantibiotic [Streptococcus suis]
MLNFKESAVTGAAFEDMSVAEMSRIQGSGDISPETTPACALIISKAISGAAVSFAFSVGVVKTVKGNC